MTEEGTTPIEMELVLDFTDIRVSELTELLMSLNDFFTRSFISWLWEILDQKRLKDKKLSEPCRKTLDLLGQSYKKYYRDSSQYPLSHYPLIVEKKDVIVTREHHLKEYQSGIDSIADWAVFNQYVDDGVFNEWVSDGLRGNHASITSIREGNSVDIALSFMAISYLATFPLDYSLYKDLAQYVMGRIRNGIRKRPPKHTLESVPQILESLGRNRNIKKFKLKAQDEEIDLVIEYQEKTKYDS